MSYDKVIKLVGHVGKKSHLTSSLDSYGELSLVKSAGAGNTSGEDLSSLGDELSELSYILVIDLAYFILAEDTNLLSLARSLTSGANIVSCVIFHVGKTNLS